VPGFLSGLQVGAVVGWGADRGFEPPGFDWPRGQHNGRNLHIARKPVYIEDRVTMTQRPRHQLSFGAMVHSGLQSNEIIALSPYGQATFASLATFLQGTASRFC